jgi:hypothetical protein
MANKKIELTEAQVKTLIYAIEIFESTLAGVSEEEMRYFGYNRDLAVLGRIMDKLEGKAA